MSNINGYCKHCGSDMDGENIIQTYLDQGVPKEKALEWAMNTQGWDQHKEKNCWGRQIGIYDINTDMTIYYKCPDCGEEI